MKTLEALRQRMKKSDAVIDAIIKIYLITYLVIMLVYGMANRPWPEGEWDDYCLPTISIINEHNISITPSDVAKAKEYFPEWAEALDNYSLSGFKTKAGGEMAFYFPTYSLAAVPYVVLLHIARLPAVYAYTLTNLTAIFILILIVWKHMRIGRKRKLALIVLLTVNPIVFYYTWTSAETFIFAVIGLSLVFWCNREYKQAALFISIAGTLNPTIMVIGMAIILDYFIYILQKQRGEGSLLKRLKNEFKNIMTFGSCFVISLVPFAYNYYNTHHINLTAAHSGFLTGSSETVFQRFLAYLFDLNFGILPYYCVVFTLALMLIPFAIVKRQWKYLLMLAAWLGTIATYSIMIHINSGMSGIARYNAWSAVVMIFAVCLYFDSILTWKATKKITSGLLAASSLISAYIIFKYGPMRASNTSYVWITPIARRFLDNMPSVYNPLYSTFNSRINHVDGGYSYETPIIYVDKNGAVRKILAASKDREILLNSYSGDASDKEWFVAKVNGLTKNASYISVPKSVSLKKLEK